jgi:hypothetical protein
VFVVTIKYNYYNNGFIKAGVHLILKHHDMNKFLMVIQLNADIPVMALPSTNA